MEVLVHISGIVNDSATNSYIVLLKGERGEEILPIWIGILEAGAIAMALENVAPPRPMTQDLMKTVFDVAGVSVERILINDLRENTFYATLCLAQDGKKFEVDSRPSDALAIALRHKAPIYVNEEVFRKQASESVDSWFRNFEKDGKGYNA
ncbi:MAG: bifunctional nuclease family protein [Nitrospirota bacterium]|nr:bifunctional nuclease family protein [Nitrospirota bacterium]